MNFQDWFIDICYRATPSGIVDNYGQKSYNIAVFFKARVEPNFQMVQNTKGAEVQAKYKIATHSEINYMDKLWLPAQDPLTDDAYIPLSIRKASTKTGNYTLYEVYL